MSYPVTVIYPATEDDIAVQELGEFTFGDHTVGVEIEFFPESEDPDLYVRYDGTRLDPDDMDNRFFVDALEAWVKEQTGLALNIGLRESGAQSYGSAAYEGSPVAESHA